MCFWLVLFLCHCSPLCHIPLPVLWWCIFSHWLKSLFCIMICCCNIVMFSWNQSGCLLFSHPSTMSAALIMLPLIISQFLIPSCSVFPFLTITSLTHLLHCSLTFVSPRAATLYLFLVLQNFLLLVWLISLAEVCLWVAYSLSNSQLSWVQ